jgi:hypothetical protein
MVYFVAHDLYYIKSDAFINAIFFVRIIERRTADSPLLFYIHRFGRRPEPALRSRLHLAEHNGLTVLKNDIDLAAAYAVVPFEYGAALSFQIRRCLSFAAVAPLAHIHPINFFKNDIR